MIKIRFFKNESNFTGFEVAGHAMYDEYGKDIICAFVSSACLMTANTITEVMHIKADALSRDGYMKLQLNDSYQTAQDVLGGLVFHMTELEKEYPKNVKVIISEV